MKVLMIGDVVAKHGRVAELGARLVVPEPHGHAVGRGEGLLPGLRHAPGGADHGARHVGHAKHRDRERVLPAWKDIQQDHLADVPYVDSAGLGEIVRCYTTVSRKGGRLKLLNLTKKIQDLLAITKLLTVFETYDNEADAVRSFSSANV